VAAQGLQIHCTILVNILLRASIWLHRARIWLRIKKREKLQALQYIAQCLQIYCVGPANTLYRACKYTTKGLQIYYARIRPAKTVHKPCKYTAQGLQIHCEGPTNTLRRTCKYSGTAEGLHIHCTGAAITLRRTCKFTTKSLQIRSEGPTNTLRRTYKYCTGAAKIFHWESFFLVPLPFLAPPCPFLLF